MLESLEVERVLHCGDIGSPAIVPLFSAWPTHFVFGNVDYDAAQLREAIESNGQTCHDEFGSIELSQRRIALLHGDDTSRLRDVSCSGSWDLVCYGHTHVARQFREGPTLLVNPGAIYRANPHSIAVVDLSNLTATSIVI